MSISDTSSTMDVEHGSYPRRTVVAVEVPPVKKREEYIVFEGNIGIVQKVVSEFVEHGQVMFEVKFVDDRTEVVSFVQLLELEDGPSALEKFSQDPPSHEDEGRTSRSSDSDMKLRKTVSSSNHKPGFVDISTIQLSSEDDDIAVAEVTRPHATRGKLLSSTVTGSNRHRSQVYELSESSSASSETSEDFRTQQGSRRAGRIGNAKKIRNLAPRRSGRQRNAMRDFDDEEEENEDELYSDRDILRSDVVAYSRKRKRITQVRQPRLVIRGLKDEKVPRAGARQSNRSTRNRENMQEAGLVDVYRSDSEPSQPNAAPKVVGVREAFKELSRNSAFRNRHIQGCDTCGNGTDIGPLVYCQGCSFAYHKGCLGNRNGRDHLVTKVEEGDFVLQCKRCVNTAQKRDHTAPDLARCQVCRETGLSCVPFRDRKSPLQEQKEREENNGEDPIAEVSPELLNNMDNVLFRCISCWRGFHYHHLPTRLTHHMDIDRDDDEAAEERFQEYSRDWKCKDCVGARKVTAIIAWRPSDMDSYVAGFSCEMMNEDEKEYLVKWEEQSYFRATWQPGAWTWGVTAPAMRKAFNKKEDGPKMRTEDAIPEEFLRIDIVLDVKYTSIVDIHTEEIDKARIKEVDQALIKYKGLGYEDAVWEKVPTPEDGDRWIDFVTAYNDWVLGRYVKIPKQGPLRIRLEKARATPFTKLEKQKQPENLTGGELMKYQVDGLNWLYYQWYSKKNGILADEMGLGKTIQIIGFMATLVQDHNCFPFLVVVPNSTCANWRREIKQWAPSLRVVTYFGSAAARRTAYNYEMFPEQSKDLRCHVVVTSYDAAADESCKRFFKGVSWAGLVVDEGQRLKNDRSQLYAALNALKVPFKVLLTGTPLQNNARELFNLLQFLDDSHDAAQLEEEYAEMTSDNVKKLHDLIRPYILRRTKAQVLTFLPPMAQIIVPISMSVLQKKLYKSILAKNPELLRALFTTTSRALKPQERANLSNILMQLRKCLCHPFVYSREIEERTEIAAVSHRNLVEASAKLQLLELLLPKLRERGHRVLIFSQFLDMLSIIEDFLDGLEMPYQRLDGTMGSLEKQKRIDQFNAPESPLFAFLLSTRAGGVGINLATADTVIILDPDFNPHQDIQALSRAHRIGQKKKVLCFQLMTRASAEEKIVQIGRKKMALDHVVVEQLDAEDLEEKDVESVLKHGAAELFKEDGNEQDIRYDSSSVDKLLDRSQIENTKIGGDDSAESQFSFARVWANDQGALEDSLNPSEDEEASDPTVWDKILKDRERAAAAEAAARQEALGRGKRARMNVDYTVNEREAGNSPVKPRSRRRIGDSDSDTDFQAEQTDAEESAGDDEQVNPEELTEQRDKKKGGMAGTIQSTGNGSAVKPFVRAPLPITPPITSHISYATPACPACQLQHPRGACALKLAGAEHCGLCGLAHYGAGRICPHINSETQVREMLETLKNSTEPKHLVETATKYLRGVKGHLVQKKKREREKALGIIVNVNGAMHGPTTSASAQGHDSAAIGADGAGQGAPNSRSLEDRAVESALLGYLGR